MNLDDEVTLAPVPEPEKPWVVYICYDEPNKCNTGLETVITTVPAPKSDDPLGIIRRGLMKDGLILDGGKDWVPPHAIRRAWLAKES